MKAYWGVEVYLHAFPTSALDGGECKGPVPVNYMPTCLKYAYSVSLLTLQFIQ